MIDKLIINENGMMNNKWDLRFLEMAKLISTWSKDPSTKCGAVIVRPDKSVCSVGFNGFPQSMKDDEELYADREKKYSRVVHCEVNALIYASERVKGYTLYTYPLACCDRCAVQMLQAGISRFVFPALPEDKVERWGKSLELTKSYYQEANIEYAEYNENGRARRFIPAKSEIWVPEPVRIALDKLNKEVYDGQVIEF